MYKQFFLIIRLPKGNEQTGLTEGASYLVMQAHLHSVTAPCEPELELVPGLGELKTLEVSHLAVITLPPGKFRGEDDRVNLLDPALVFQI